MLLYGFSAVTQQVITVIVTQQVNIRCHKGFLIDGHPLSSVFNGQVDCRAEYDRCGTVTFNGGSVNITMMNCTRSSTDCDHMCDAVIAQGFVNVSGCVESCCDSDMCNAPGEELRMRVR